MWSFPTELELLVGKIIIVGGWEIHDENVPVAHLKKKSHKISLFAALSSKFCFLSSVQSTWIYFCSFARHTNRCVI